MLYHLKRYFTYSLTFVYTSTAVLAAHPDELASFYRLMVGQKDYKNGREKEFVALVDALRSELDIEEITVNSTLSGILYRPKDMKPHEKRPCVIHSHGADFANKIKVSTKHAEMSFLAAKKGAVVFAPNYNGPEKQATQDLITAIKFMQSQPYVDATRVMLRGGSNGSMRNARVLKYAQDLKLAGVHFFGGSYDDVHHQYDEWPQNVPILIAHGLQDYGPRSAITFMRDLLYTNLIVETFVSHSGDHHLIDQEVTVNDPKSPSAQELLDYLNVWLDFHTAVLEGRPFQPKDTGLQKLAIDKALAVLTHQKIDENQALQQLSRFSFAREHLRLHIAPFSSTILKPQSSTLSPSLAYVKLVLGKNHTGDRDQDVSQFLTQHFYDQSIGRDVVAKKEPHVWASINTMLTNEQEAWDQGQHALYHTAVSSAATLYAFNSLWRQALDDFTQPASVNRLRGVDKSFKKYADVNAFLSVMEKRQSGWGLFNYAKGFNKVGISVNCLGLFGNHASDGSNTFYWWLHGNAWNDIKVKEEATRFLKAIGMADSWRIDRYSALLRKFAKPYQDQVLFQILIPQSLNDQWGYICEGGGYPLRLDMEGGDKNTLKPSQILSRFSQDPQKFENNLSPQRHKFRSPNHQLYSETIQERLIIHPTVIDDPQTTIHVFPRSPDRYQRLIQKLAHLTQQDLIDFLLQKPSIQKDWFLTPITVQQKFEDVYHSETVISKEITNQLATLQESDIPHWFETLKDEKKQRGALCALLQAGKWDLVDHLRGHLDTPTLEKDLTKTAVSTKNLAALYWLKTKGILENVLKATHPRNAFTSFLQIFTQVVQEVIGDDIVIVPGSVTAATMDAVYRNLQSLGYKGTPGQFCRQLLEQSQDVQFYEVLLASTRHKEEVVAEILTKMTQSQDPSLKRQLANILVHHLDIIPETDKSRLAHLTSDLFAQSFKGSKENSQEDFKNHLKVISQLRLPEYKAHLDQLVLKPALCDNQMMTLCHHYFEVFDKISPDQYKYHVQKMDILGRLKLAPFMVKRYVIDVLTYRQALLIYTLTNDHRYIQHAASNAPSPTVACGHFQELYHQTGALKHLRSAIAACDDDQEKYQLVCQLFNKTGAISDLFLGISTARHAKRNTAHLYLLAYKAAQQESVTEKYYNLMCDTLDGLMMSRLFSQDDAQQFEQALVQGMAEFGFKSKAAWALSTMKKIINPEVDIHQFLLDIYRTSQSQKALKFIIDYYTIYKNAADDLFSNVMALHRNCPSENFFDWLLITCDKVLEKMSLHSSNKSIVNRLFLEACDQVILRVESSAYKRLLKIAHSGKYWSRVEPILKSVYQNQLDEDALKILFGHEAITVEDFTRLIQEKGRDPVLESMIGTPYFQKVIHKRQQSPDVDATILEIFNKYHDPHNNKHQELNILLNEDDAAICRFYHRLPFGYEVYDPEILLNVAKRQHNWELVIRYFKDTKILKGFAEDLVKRRSPAELTLFLQYLFLTLNDDALPYLEWCDEPSKREWDYLITMAKHVKYIPPLQTLKDLYPKNLYRLPDKRSLGVASEPNYRLAFEVYRESYQRSKNSQYLYDLLEALAPQYQHQKVSQDTREIIEQTVDILLDQEKNLSPLIQLLKSYPQRNWLSQAYRDQVIQAAQ